jgi:Fe-S cluster assembly protein SufD
MTSTTTDRPHTHGPVSTGSPAERFTSRDPEAFAVPRGREEDWRFTPVRKITDLFEPFAPDDTFRLDTDLPEGVTLEIVGRDHPLFGTVLTPADRVSAIAMAEVRQVVLVSIAKDAVLDRPVLLRSIGRPGRNYGHFVIDAGAFSSAAIVMDHVGEVTVAANVEVRVGDGAAIKLVSLQDWADGSTHLAAHAALIGRDARYQHTSVNLGGSIIRMTPTVRFAGPGGQAELLGVNFAGAGQHMESRLYIDHSVPECTSNVLYKNALLGETARTVWIGDVRIRPTATGTSTYEMNRNLLLTDGARADSVPNLEIETGNIAGAGHASATGRFDDLQLFYLQSRGIEADEAQRLVVRGFFADVVDRIGLPDLQRRIMTAVEARLGFAAAEADLESTDA